MGPSIEYWRGQPFAYLLWSYRHLQELDRRHQWVGRMHRLDGAVLGAMAFHDPKLLEVERGKALADARDSGAPDDEAMERARMIAVDLPLLLTERTNGAG